MQFFDNIIEWGQQSKGLKVTAYTVVGLVILYKLGMGIFNFFVVTIEQGNIGILYSKFSNGDISSGNVTGVETKKNKDDIRLVGQGWYPILPIRTGVESFPLTAQTVNYNTIFRDKGSLQLTAPVVMKFHVDSTNPRGIVDLFLQYRQGLPVITDQLVIPTLRDSISYAGTQYNGEDINGEKRGEFQNKVRDYLQNKLMVNGIIVDDVLFPDSITLPQIIQEAIDAKTRTRQEIERVEQEKIREQQEAEKKQIIANGNATAITIEANATAYKTLTEARAQAEANKLLQQAITPELIKMKYIEKWDGKLPNISAGSGNTDLMLNINK